MSLRPRFKLEFRPRLPSSLLLFFSILYILYILYILSITSELGSKVVFKPKSILDPFRNGFLGG